jgi:hypothetical protein
MTAIWYCLAQYSAPSVINAAAALIGTLIIPIETLKRLSLLFTEPFVLKNLIINDSKKIKDRYTGITISCIFEVTISPKVPSNIIVILAS